MHTPHSLTHPYSLYPTNYTSLTFKQAHSQSPFNAHDTRHTFTHCVPQITILSHSHTHTLSILLIYTLTHPHSISPTLRLTLYHSYTTPFTHTCPSTRLPTQPHGGANLQVMRSNQPAT